MLSARGEVHRVDSFSDSQLDHLELLVEDLAVGLVVLDRVDADPERDLGVEAGAERADDLEEQPRAILDVPTPAIGAGVHRRREELVDQVAVAGVQLDGVEARARRQRSAASTNCSTTSARSDSVATWYSTFDVGWVYAHVIAAASACVTMP